MKNLITLALLALTLTACTPKEKEEKLIFVEPEPEELFAFTVTNEMLVDEEIGEAIGHKVHFEGSFTQDFEFHFSVEDEDEEEEMITGDETYIEGFYFAGVQSDLVFVRSGNLLQIQEQITYEDGSDGGRSVFETIDLPASAELIFSEG